MRSVQDTPGTTNVWFEFALASASNPKQNAERLGYVSLANCRDFHNHDPLSRPFAGVFPVKCRKIALRRRWAVHR